jgi:cytochrome c-type biogenesis protein CcmF
MSLPAISRRRYGGYIVHLGIVLMFIGFTGQSWNIDRETTLSPGQTYAIGDYTLIYQGPRMEVDNNKRMIFADVDIAKGGKTIGHITPAKFIYKKQPESPTTEVAIHNGFRDDVYVIVGTINPQTKMAALQIHINPLVDWIWGGCLVLIAGSIVCMWPQLEFGESRVWAGARGVAAVTGSVIFGIMLAATPAANAQTPAKTMTQGENTGTVHIENDRERAVFGQLRCMCGTCAREPLSTCTCETAEEARENIRAKLLAGEAQDKILEEYVAKYGTEALTVPPNTGFSRAIWAVPVAAIGLGAIGLGTMVRRWRSSGAKSDPKGARPRQPTVRDAYDAQLDDELKDLDD